MARQRFHAIRRKRAKVSSASRFVAKGRELKATVYVDRNATGSYRGIACLVGAGYDNEHRRCGESHGKTPTAAVKASLAKLAKNIR